MAGGKIAALIEAARQAARQAVLTEARADTTNAVAQALELIEDEISGQERAITQIQAELDKLKGQT